MARKCSDILAVYPAGDNIVEAALSRFNGPPSHSQIMTASLPSNLHRPNELAGLPHRDARGRRNCSPDKASSLIDPAKGGAFFERNVTPRRELDISPTIPDPEVARFAESGQMRSSSVGGGGGGSESYGLGIFEAAGAREKSSRTLRACNALP